MMLSCGGAEPASGGGLIWESGSGDTNTVRGGNVDAVIINGGRISKLTLTIDGECVYNYDRGEDLPPQNEAAEKALAILLAEYDEQPKQTPEWPENLGDEDLVNDYRASLMLGSAELTEALRLEILRRMRGPEF